jgi:type III restriction enzyme
MQTLAEILNKQVKDETSFYSNFVPVSVTRNLHPKYSIRPYQKEALGRFDFYWKNDLKKNHQPTHLLYHMATGSGKTLVMAGLIIYLYKQGYRNFLFFVNSANIIDKTRDNFLNNQSSKYLFTNEIVIDSKVVSIKEVNNFQSVNNNDISIVFSTIQGLHSSLITPKENSLTFEDFEDNKLALISDEAHHINAETKKGVAIDTAEKEALISWEGTIKKILQANSSNVLIEFTATLDITNIEIEKKYADKLIFDYSLHQFRQDGYSKEVTVLQADIPTFDRALQAIILSQYRGKLFEQYHQNIKPVILFKSKTIKDSDAFYHSFLGNMQQLQASDLERLKPQNNNHILWHAYNYFKAKNISYENLVFELQADFSEDKLLSVNSKNDSEQKQLAVNSLEDVTNNYRAIFAVDKLNEGWDVLNLFDIVRLYKTKNDKQSKPDKTTVSEAQLIGRGARYCPFNLPNLPLHFTRQFDTETTHELRICETLLYHSSYNPKYIAELHTALVEIGIVTDEKLEKKPEKKNSITTNKIAVISNETLISRICKQKFIIHLKTGETEYSQVFEAIDDNKDVNSTETHFLLKKFGDHIIRKAINTIAFYQYNHLQKLLPSNSSVSAFISTYLHNISVTVIGSKTQTANLSSTEKLAVCKAVLDEIKKTKV